MSDKHVRVIFINSKLREVTERIIKDHLTDLHEMLGGYMECPYIFDSNGQSHSLMVWEEALIQSSPPKHWFFFEGWTQPIAGNGVVLAYDKEGETIDATVSVDEIGKRVMFL